MPKTSDAKKNSTAPGNAPREGSQDGNNEAQIVAEHPLGYYTAETLFVPPEAPKRDESDGKVKAPDLAALLQEERWRFWVVFSFIFWPLGLILIAGYFLLNRLFLSRSRGWPKASFKSLILLWLKQPLYVLRLARQRSKYRLLFAVLLLMPLFLATFWGIYVLVWFDWDRTGLASTLLASPLQHLPMGTDGQGRGIFTQIAAGGRHSYFASLIAVMAAIGIGLVLGRATNNTRADGAVMLLVQLVETIPLLFILMIVFALFSDWSADLAGAGVKAWLRVSVLGFGLGFGFSPFVVRLVRDKIRTLKSEEFVSAAKAHGIPQRDIIWRHIIRKNALTNIVILAAQIWGFAMLMEISLSYVFSIGSAKLGGEPYHSWAWMLLTQESKNALIGNVENLFVNWWLWFFPAFFTGATIVGFYLFGDALKQWHSRREQFGIPVVRSSFEEELQRQLAVRGKSKLQALLKGI